MLTCFRVNVDELSPVRLPQASGSYHDFPDNLPDVHSLVLIASAPATNVRLMCRVSSYR